MKILKGNTVNFEITINLSASGLVGVNLSTMTVEAAAINNAYTIQIPTTDITVVNAVNGVITFNISGTKLDKVGFYTLEIVVTDNTNALNIYRSVTPNAFTITENAYEVDDDTTITDEIIISLVAGTAGSTPIISVSENTTDSYKLKVTQEGLSDIITPNLKGTSGSNGTNGSTGTAGIDGTNYDFIFILTNTNVAPFTPTTSQVDAYVPSGWSSNTLSVTSTNQYQWTSKRSKTAGTWSAYSAPSLWSKYAIDGTNGTDGNDGANGLTIRTTVWTIGADLAGAITYRNDSTLETVQDTYYLDIVQKYDTDGLTYTLFKCVQTHTCYTGNEHTPGTDTAYWQLITQAEPIYTALLLADNAKINLTQTNDLVITKVVDNALQVTAGLSGNTTNNVRIWAGATSANKATAPFRVTEDGKMVATNAEIVGSITANTAIFTGGSRTITKKIVFGDSGTDYTISMLSDLNATYANKYAGQVNVFLPATIDYDGAEAFILNTDYYDGSNVNSYPFLLTLTSTGFTTAKISATGLESTGEILGIKLNGNAYAKLRAVWVAAITSTGVYDTVGKLIWMLENTTDFTAEETSTGSGQWVLNSKTNNWG